MQTLVNKYAGKLIHAGLAESGQVLVGGLDDELAWNADHPAQALLREIFSGLKINSLALVKQAEPYATTIDFLAGRALRDADSTGRAAIFPSDCETRTFLHDLPVARELAPETAIRALKGRKCLIVPGQGVLAHGTVSPEQCFVTISSVAFACFVKFLADYLALLRQGQADEEYGVIFERVRSMLPGFHAAAESGPVDLAAGPFSSIDDIHAAMCRAGRATVNHRLVDSSFGNISYTAGGVVHISQTGSALDELEGCIDPCPLDGSSSAGLTASSELTAHMEIVTTTPMRAILHGHPRFSVILSMDCDSPDCPHRGRCHLTCPEKRLIHDIPIVPGEVGTGAHGLCHTLPPAIQGRRGVIVYGHGLFTVAEHDFRQAFATLKDVEEMCEKEYFSRVDDLAG